MTELVDNGWLSSSLVRRIGYCLLVLALFDLLSVLIPPRLADPAWVFQTIGALVERTAVPLIGLGLVFYGQADFRPKWERLPLQFLSWAALLYGMLFLLLAPLLILNSLRVDSGIYSQINAQVTQQLSQLERLEQQIGQAITPQDINTITARLNLQKLPPDIKSPQQLKSLLLPEITKAKEIVRPRIEAAWADKRFSLLKSSIKWFLGTMVSGSVFIYIWYLTRWARLSSRWSR